MNLFQNLKSIIIVGLIIRFWLAFSYGTGDTGAFCDASGWLLQGKEVYNAPNIAFSAPPFGLHLTGLTHFLGNVFHLPCAGMWKMPSVLADAGIAWLIYVIAIKYLHTDKQKALSLTKWYMFNPIALIVSGYHGQQDAFWVFLILLAWYIMYFHKNLFLAAVTAGLSLSYKLPAILLLPGLVILIKGFMRRSLFIIIIAVVFSLSLLPEIVTSTRGVIKQSFLYSSTPGVWGFSSLASKFFINFGIAQENIKYVSILLELIMVIALFVFFVIVIKRKFNFFIYSIGVVCIFFIFSPGFGTQYLLWPLPFLILGRNKFLKIYTIFVTFAYLHTYGFFFPPLDFLMIFLQNNLYYKMHMLYPYDLYIPVWICFFFILGKLLFIGHATGSDKNI